MACSNCYNGCTDIISDKCVKYTGIDVPVLGILNGDSLSYVEQAIIEFLTSTLDGTGIKLTIDSDDICELVSQYIPDCEDLSALNLFKALIAAACNLQEQIDAIDETLATLNADYDVDCLEDITSSSDTHDVLQATITKLCEVDADLTALAADVETNYVKLADLNSLIQAYLDTISPVTQYNTRMVPYTAVEYYGSLSNFDGSGAGISANGFDKIYLCNGNNGTPDKRGRSPIGAIQGVGGGAMSVVVDPAYPGNTNYALLTTNGVNTITLTSAQMPSHTHTAVAVVADPGHSHYTTAAGASVALNSVNSLCKEAAYGNNSSYLLASVEAIADLAPTNAEDTGITVGVTNASTGNSQSHNNVHPVLACYYIIYIP